MNDCPDGYELFSFLCLKAITHRISYIDANNACAQDGATLPIIRSSEVQQQLLEFLRTYPRLDPFWLGLSYSNQIAGGIWNTGEIFNRDEYDRFSNSKRLNGAKSCTIFNRRFDEWRNHFCLNRRYTVCMKWSERAKSVVVSSNSLPQIRGKFKIGSGIILNNASVYVNTMDLQQPLYLYREKTGECFSKKEIYFIGNCCSNRKNMNNFP